MHSRDCLSDQMIITKNCLLREIFQLYRVKFDQFTLKHISNLMSVLGIYLIHSYRVIQNLRPPQGEGPG